MSKIYQAFKKEIQNENILKIITSNIDSNSRARMLLSNLKRDYVLKNKLLNGDIDPFYFATKITHEEIQPQKIIQTIDSTERQDGLIRCEECDSYKTEYHEIHKLENSITHVFCHNCNHRFKIE